MHGEPLSYSIANKSKAVGSGGDKVSQCFGLKYLSHFLWVGLVLRGCTFTPRGSDDLYESVGKTKLLELFPDDRQIRRPILL